MVFCHMHDTHVTATEMFGDDVGPSLLCPADDAAGGDAGGGEPQGSGAPAEGRHPDTGRQGWFKTDTETTASWSRTPVSKLDNWCERKLTVSEVPTYLADVKMPSHQTEKSPCRSRSAQH